MIDPRAVTNFERNDSELEEFLIFTISVAGKSANMIARKVEAFLRMGTGTTPFEKIRHLIRRRMLVRAMKKVKLGKYTLLGNAFTKLVRSDLDLRTCSLEALESVPGIGLKTSRFFVLHSRRDQAVAILDTHILKYLASLGHEVPRHTPQNPAVYSTLQELFLKEARRSGKNVAEFDLEIWKRYHKPEDRAIGTSGIV